MIFRVVTALITSCLCLAAPGSWQCACGQTQAPDAARAAAADYLDYALSRNSSEPGFFFSHFGVEPPARGKGSFTLGEPYSVFVLSVDGLRRFVDAGNSDLLSYAELLGFGFPLLDEGQRIVGIITTGKVKGTWMWSQVFANNNPEVAALRRAEGAASSPNRTTIVSLFIRGRGTVMLEMDGTNITHLVPLNDLLGGRLGATADSSGNYEFMDYDAAARELRSHEKARNVKERRQE